MVEYTANGSFTDFSPISTMSLNASITDLTPGTEYTVRVRAISNDPMTYFNSSPSMVSSETTSGGGGGGGGGGTPLSAPSGLTVSNATANSFKVSWTPVMDATGYTIRYSTSSNFLSGTQTQNSPTVPVGGLTISGLQSSTPYYVSIKANGDGIMYLDSEYSQDIPQVSIMTLAGGGGGAGDPYMTTVSGISYKLPTMDAPIRLYQGEVEGKTLTVNATLRTIPASDLLVENVRSAIGLSKTIGAKKAQTLLKDVLEKNETLCFFENFYVNYGKETLAVNAWDATLKVLKNTGGLKARLTKGAEGALKASGVYSKYDGATLAIEIGASASVNISYYGTPLVRNGITVDAPNMAKGNGAIVNALTADDMTIRALDDTTMVVPKRDAKYGRIVKEHIADHDGLRTRNVLTFH